MRASTRSLATLLGLVFVGALPAVASPVSPDDGQVVRRARLADLPRADLWCRVQRPTTHQARQRWWSGLSDTTRPKWILQPRWPQLFADGRQSPLSLDPILRRHWWD